jgi:hypothetical protein
VLSSILSMAVMMGGMPIGLGIPNSRLDFDDYGPPLPARKTTRELHQPVRSAAEIERRKKRKTRRKSRKGRK